jgi:hypothetical protein
MSGQERGVNSDPSGDAQDAHGNPRCPEPADEELGPRSLDLKGHPRARDVGRYVKSIGRDTARQTPNAGRSAPADCCPDNLVTVLLEKECGDRETEESQSHEFEQSSITEEPVTFTGATPLIDSVPIHSPTLEEGKRRNV